MDDIKNMFHVHNFPLCFLTRSKICEERANPQKLPAIAKRNEISSPETKSRKTHR